MIFQQEVAGCQLPVARCHLKRRRTTRLAFTLVEILVAIGIIVILIGLLIPVVNRVRTSAREADVRNQLAVLSAAIKMYEMDFRAYPGPLSNDEIIQGASVIVDASDQDQITMSENLVLGLLGGLWNDGGTITFDWERVGKGPSSLGNSPTKKNPYLESTNLSWNLPGYTPSDLSGEYKDSIADIDDSNIPEFVDRFSDPMPILYYRARVGADGVIGDGGTLQYDVRQNLAYTQAYSGQSIGIGREFPNHGLVVLGDINDSIVDGPNDALPYFKHPTIADTPREKDSYILISAGKDRVYGTKDDICNFGGVEQ